MWFGVIFGLSSHCIDLVKFSGYLVIILMISRHFVYAPKTHFLAHNSEKDFNIIMDID